MANNNNNSRKAEKFLFDAHCFDDDYEEEIEEEKPPPPTYSEEELSAAQEASYKRGRQEALAEAEAAREKYVAQLLDKMTTKFEDLFHAESEREDRFQSESVKLSREIFEKLFPALQDHHGLDEIKHLIDHVLTEHRGHDEITIFVHPEYAESIDKHLDSIRGKLAGNTVITVKSNDTVDKGDVQMAWQDGGARRDSAALATQIREKLEELLADKPLLQDNGISDNGNVKQDADSEAEQSQMAPVDQADKTTAEQEKTSKPVNPAPEDGDKT